MYIQFEQLIREIRKRRSVQTYNLAPVLITGVALLPPHFEEALGHLRMDTLYLCEPRQLRRVSAQAALPPILCVVDKDESDPEDILRSRTAAVIHDADIPGIMLELMESLYALGADSSRLTEISHELTRCDTLKDLIDKAFAFIGNPVIVTDVNQRIVTYTSPEEASHPVYQEMLALGYLPEGHPLPQTTDDALRLSDIPFYESGYEELPSVLCKRLSVAGRTLGFLHVLQFYRKLEPADISATELLGNLIAAELSKQPAADDRSTKDRQVESCLRDMLDNARGEVYAARRLEEIGLTPKPCLYTILLRARSTEFVPRISLYELSKRLASKLPDCFGMLYQNAVLLFVESDEEISDFNMWMAPIMDDLRRYNFIAGVSNCFYSLTSIGTYYRQCGIAHRLGAAENRDRVVYLYRDYYIRYMLEICQKQEPAEMLLLPELFRLKEHSAKDGGELMITLKTYLSCGRSKSRTARALYIHLNTVKYRIAQAQELLGLDIEKDDNSLKLELSLMLIDNIGRLN